MNCEDVQKGVSYLQYGRQGNNMADIHDLSKVQSEKGGDGETMLHKII